MPPMTKRSAGAIFVILVLCVAAHADKADLKKQIVAKWSVADEPTIHVEYTTDGKVLFTATTDAGEDAPASTGSYKWVDAQSIEVTTTALGKTRTTRYKVAITGNTMTTTTDKGKVAKYTRTK